MVKIQSRVKEIIGAVRQAMKDARIETAEEIGEIAKKNAPKKTGALANSQFTEHDNESSFVGFSAKHALKVEFGDSRQSGQAYFVPAMVLGERILEQKTTQKLRKIK